MVKWNVHGPLMFPEPGKKKHSLKSWTFRKLREHPSNVLLT